MSFELTKDYIHDLRDAMTRDDENYILEKLTDLHPADIAEVFNELEVEEAKFLYKFLDFKKAADVLIELDEDVREDFLESMTTKEIAEQFIENLESDDAADVLGTLPQDIREEVIHHLEDVDQASDIVDLMNYPEGTAGALMGTEYICVNHNWTVVKCVKEMRKQAEHTDAVYTVYVVDDNNRLLGTISLKKLLLTPAKTKVVDLYNPDVLAVKAMTPSEDIAQMMEKYDLVVLPVIDGLGRLIGRITIDDVMDVVKEEAEEDYRMASGISESVESKDKILVLTRARLPWLIIGLLGGILGAQVIGIYEEQIQIYPEMAFFIPLIAAMGGNVGVQSSAIIVQGLANKSHDFSNLTGRLMKEFAVGALNGVICSGLILLYNVLFSDSINLSITVSLALFSVIVFAALFGTIVPLLLNKYRIDPALATGPFITTVNDVLGLFIYFIIGHYMYV